MTRDVLNCSAAGDPATDRVCPLPEPAGEEVHVPSTGQEAGARPSPADTARQGGRGTRPARQPRGARGPGIAGFYTVHRL